MEIPLKVRELSNKTLKGFGIKYLGTYKGLSTFINVFPRDYAGATGLPFVYVYGGNSANILSTAEDAELMSFIDEHF